MQIFLVFFAFLRIICHSTHRGNEGETCGRPAKDPRKTREKMSGVWTQESGSVNA